MRQAGSIKKLKWDIDFAEILIKGRASKGNLVTKYAVKRVELKEKGISTLKPRKIWFDDTVQRLNLDGRGELIGEFRGEDKLLIINQSGVLKTVTPEVTMHFDDDMIVLEKWVPKKPISVIYYNGEKELYYVKRFLVEQEGKEESFISDHQSSQLEIISTDWKPMAEVIFAKERGKDRKDNLEVNLEEFIAIKGISALGNQLTKDKVIQINLMESLPYEAPEEVHADDLEVVDETDVSSNVSGGEKDNSSDSNGDTDQDFGMDGEGQTSLF